jgi:hypothetical protein
MRLVWLAAAILTIQPVIAQTTAGLDTTVLSRFDADIASGKYGNVDSVLILHHGEVAFDRTYNHDYRTIYAEAEKKAQTWSHLDPGGPYNYFNPWWHPYLRNAGTLHTEQSVTKTVLSMVIGIATTRGEFPSLNTPVLKFFDGSKVANLDDRKRHLTLRNLLTMTVGMKWNGDLPYDDPNNMTTIMEESPDWVKTFIDQPMQEEPGTKFYYNDGAPQALGYIFRKATGQDVEEYAAKISLRAARHHQLVLEAFAQGHAGYGRRLVSRPPRPRQTDAALPARRHVGGQTHRQLRLGQSLDCAAGHGRGIPRRQVRVSLVALPLWQGQRRARLRRQWLRRSVPGGPSRRGYRHRRQRLEHRHPQRPGQPRSDLARS